MYTRIDNAELVVPKKIRFEFRTRDTTATILRLNLFVIIMSLRRFSRSCVRTAVTRLLNRTSVLRRKYIPNILLFVSRATQYIDFQNRMIFRRYYLSARETFEFSRKPRVISEDFPRSKSANSHDFTGGKKKKYQRNSHLITNRLA